MCHQLPGTGERVFDQRSVCDSTTVSQYSQFLGGNRLCLFLNSVGGGSAGVADGQRH